jgi:NTP pyrophosphatase (non-canonical NTP hydrolase)
MREITHDGGPNKSDGAPSDGDLPERIDYDALQAEIRRWAIEKGWLDPEAEPRPIGELLMLVVTEVAESVEAHRAGNPPCERAGMEHLTHMAEELADVIIRLVQMADEHRIEISMPLHYTKTLPRSVLRLHWGIVSGAMWLSRTVSDNMDARRRREALAALLLTVEDTATQCGIDLAEAVRLKMAFNWTREHKHGKTC